MKEYLVSSVEETQNIAMELGSKLGSGDVVAFYGEVGAGKTTFTHGLLRGLQSTDFVSSPTFALVNTYQTPVCPVYHFDLYRLSGAEDLYDIGYYDYLDGSGILLIEWSEKIKEEIPDTAIKITLTSLGETQRKIEIQGGLDETVNH